MRAGRRALEGGVAELDLARSVTSHRGESLRAFRARSARRRRGLEPRAAAALLQATALVERSAYALDALLGHVELLTAPAPPPRKTRAQRRHSASRLGALYSLIYNALLEAFWMGGSPCRRSGSCLVRSRSVCSQRCGQRPPSLLR